MKKILAVIGEVILLIAVLIVIKILLNHFAPGLVGNDTVSFVFYFISGFGAVLIYRLNTGKK